MILVGVLNISSAVFFEDLQSCMRGLRSVISKEQSQRERRADG